MKRSGTDVNPVFCGHKRRKHLCHPDRAVSGEPHVTLFHQWLHSRDSWLVTDIVMLTWRWLSPPINFPGSEYMSHVHKDAFNAPCPFISIMTQWITGHSSYRMMMMMAWPWWAKRMTVDLLNSTAKSLGIIISHWCGSEDTLFCTQPHWLGLTANKYMLHVRWLSTFKFSSKVEGKEHL